MRRLPSALLLALLSISMAIPGCATQTGATIIAVGKECGVDAANSLAGPAILEIETAVAQPSVGSALGSLESLAGQYGVAFVSCVVDHIFHEAAANMARGAGDEGTKSKAANSSAWLARHPIT